MTLCRSILHYTEYSNDINACFTPHSLAEQHIASLLLIVIRE